MTDFLVADGFGNLSDGLHTAGVTREILGKQWPSFGNNFTIVDLADGRKYILGAGVDVNLKSCSWSAISTIWVAFRVYRATTAATCLITLWNATDRVGNIGITAAGQVYYAPYGFGETTRYSTGTVSTGAWTNVELKIVIHAATGSVHFYLNGALDSSVTNVDTVGYQPNVTYLRLGGLGPVYSPLTSGWRITDIIAHVAAASIGVAGVYYRPADADGVDTDFTPSAGANWQCVDEIGPDEDVTYNASDGTSGHRDSLEQAGMSGVTVLTVQPLVRARKTDAGGAGLLVGAVHGGSETQGAGYGLGADYLTVTEFIDDCPSTAAAWTGAQTQAGEVSYEVV